MRPDLLKLESELAPLLQVHGVELVAIEWSGGGNQGMLRVYVDYPNGDPTSQDPSKSVPLDVITDVTRDVSSALDALDLIAESYTLELGSPGPERPIQKRADFDRFAGLDAKIALKRGAFANTVTGILRGTIEHSDGGYAVRVEGAGGKEVIVPWGQVHRARLVEHKPPPKMKPGKGPSKRQERLAARAAARAINAAHLASKQINESADGIKPSTLTDDGVPPRAEAREAKR